MRRVGQAVIIDLAGDVTNKGEQAIRDAYAEALEDDPQRVFFNFGDTEYINTSGIAVLISMVMEAEKAGRKIGLFGMSPHYQKVFKLVRLSLYADMFEGESQALLSLEALR
jgi:anti-anti-sigma factor